MSGTILATKKPCVKVGSPYTYKTTFMEQGQTNGQHSSLSSYKNVPKDGRADDFVLEKTIFSKVFEKDIRKVFIYKKAERLAKALHLITPAFADAPALRNRIDTIAIALIDSAILPSAQARAALSKELLALSSVLGIARTGGLLSTMNAELISRESHLVLQEVAAYEEPRIEFEDNQTLANLAKELPRVATSENEPREKQVRPKHVVKDNAVQKDRSDAIVSLIKQRGRVGIKDVSTVIRGVSEKTIQRELLALVSGGILIKRGERRWSTYELAQK